MERQTLCLGMAAATQDVAVDVVCELCGADLGRYFAGRRLSDGAIILAEPGSFTRVPLADVRGAKRHLVRGPRTQVGLYPEKFAGREYLRKRCLCEAGSSVKRTYEKTRELPVTPRDDGFFILAF
jgi:hypothetical protein